MDTQPTFDRSIFIPIFISGFSVIGIVIVLLIGRALSAPAEVPVTPSVTRFAYVYLGTEPAITTPLTEETEFLPPEDPIEEPGVIVTTLVPTPTIATTPTRPGANTPIILTLPNASNTSPPTATSASGPPFNPGIYDDVDSHLVYVGWNSANVAGAYQNTLHVSLSPGSTISFWFIGRELQLYYQGGSTLGQVRVTIDNVSETFDQSSDNRWISDQFANGTHSVLITHIGGGSVNLDQVVIPEPANTATPSRTPTSTQNP